jgi:hypothetical protein
VPFPKFTPKTVIAKSEDPPKVARAAKVGESQAETLASLATLGAHPPTGDVENCLDSAMIWAAIEAASRAPALDAIALERFARAAVEVKHVLSEVSPGRRPEAAALASRAWTAAAHLIRRFHYFDAYQVIDGLPSKIRKYLPQ